MANTATSRPVGRPREFDEEKVLACVMDAFWHKGYEATSLSDLCQCTGLHKGSLYQAFGGKHELFMRALKHYSDTEFDEITKVVEAAPSPLDAIRAAVHKICLDADHEKGCLMVNSMVELAPHDPEVKKALDGFRQQRVAATIEMFEAAQQQGQIRADLDPESLTRQLMLGLAGGAAMMKGLLTPEEVTTSLEQMIDSWR